VQNIIKGKELQFVLMLSFVYAVGSLGGAYFIEYYQGMPPCALCIYQRIALGAVALFFPFIWFLFQRYPGKAFYLFIPFIYLINFGISLYHTGVEQHIFPAPSQCRGNLGQHGGDVDLLRNLLLQQEVIPCDEVSWYLFGLSMATYNMLASGGLLLIWGYVLRQQRKIKRR
jgi:disulfide bond formation protein DsbB